MAARRARKPKPHFDKKTGRWIVTNWDGSTVEGSAALNASSAAVATTSRSMEVPSNSESAMPVATNSFGNEMAQTTQQPPRVPFAVVDSVAVDSPASSAGIHEGDLIIQFGNITYYNPSSMQDVAALVPEVAARKGGVDITVLRPRRPQGISEEEVERNDEMGVEATAHVIRKFTIQPRPWGGRGLLGCHIVAYTHTAQAEYQEPVSAEE